MSNAFLMVRLLSTMAIPPPLVLAEFLESDSLMPVRKVHAIFLCRQLFQNVLSPPDVSSLAHTYALSSPKWLITTYTWRNPFFLTRMHTITRDKYTSTNCNQIDNTASAKGSPLSQFIPCSVCLLGVWVKHL